MGVNSGVRSPLLPLSESSTVQNAIPLMLGIQEITEETKSCTLIIFFHTKFHVQMTFTMTRIHKHWCSTLLPYHPSLPSLSLYFLLDPQPILAPCPFGKVQDPVMRKRESGKGLDSGLTWVCLNPGSHFSVCLARSQFTHVILS